MASVNQRSFTFIPTDSRSKPAQEAIRAHIMRRRHRQARPVRLAKTPQDQFEEHIHFWKQRSDQTVFSDDPKSSRNSENSSITESPQFLDAVLEEDSESSLSGGGTLHLPNLEKLSPGKGNFEFSSQLTEQGDVEEMLIQYCKVRYSTT